MERLREGYSQEDKELIEKCLEAKRVSNLKSENLAQEPEEKDQLPSKLGVTFSLSLSLSLSD